MTPEEERALFRQLARLNDKIDWIACFVICSVVLIADLSLSVIPKEGTWLKKFWEWTHLPFFIGILAYVLYWYGRIDRRLGKEDEHREAIETARLRAEQQRVEDERNDLERRWHEFRGPGWFPRKECREWATSDPYTPRSINKTGGWRHSYAGPLLKDDPPPFVASHEDDAWKSLRLDKMIDCRRAREARDNERSTEGNGASWL
jgi:hypothetical protein